MGLQYAEFKNKIAKENGFGSYYEMVWFLYVEAGLSRRQVAGYFDVTGSSIGTNLEKMNIKPRKQGGANHKKIPSYAVKMIQSLKNAPSVKFKKTLAKNFNCHPDTIRACWYSGRRVA